MLPDYDPCFYAVTSHSLYEMMRFPHDTMNLCQTGFEYVTLLCGHAPLHTLFGLLFIPAGIALKNISLVLLLSQWLLLVLLVAGFFKLLTLFFRDRYIIYFGIAIFVRSLFILNLPFAFLPELLLALLMTLFLCQVFHVEEARREIPLVDLIKLVVLFILAVLTKYTAVFFMGPMLCFILLRIFLRKRSFVNYSISLRLFLWGVFCVTLILFLGWYARVSWPILLHYLQFTTDKYGEHFTKLPLYERAIVYFQTLFKYAVDDNGMVFIPIFAGLVGHGITYFKSKRIYTRLGIINFYMVFTCLLFMCISIYTDKVTLGNGYYNFPLFIMFVILSCYCMVGLSGPFRKVACIILIFMALNPYQEAVKGLLCNTRQLNQFNQSLVSYHWKDRNAVNFRGDVLDATEFLLKQHVRLKKYSILLVGGDTEAYRDNWALIFQGIEEKRQIPLACLLGVDSLRLFIQRAYREQVSCIDFHKIIQETLATGAYTVWIVELDSKFITNPAGYQGGQPDCDLKKADLGWYRNIYYALRDAEQRNQLTSQRYVGISGSRYQIFIKR